MPEKTQPVQHTRNARWEGKMLNKLTSVFHVSVLLLFMNFATALSKYLWIHQAIAEWISRLINLHNEVSTRQIKEHEFSIDSSVL